MLLRAYQTGKNIIRSIAASLLIGVIVGAIDAVFGRGLLAIFPDGTFYIPDPVFTDSGTSDRMDVSSFQ